MPPVKVYIVDDHTLFREGLRFLLTQSDVVSQVYEAKSGEEFLEHVAQAKPDVVLMDIEMPLLDGIETTKRALKLMPELRVITLTMYSDENYYTEMIEAGAMGFLLKNSRFEDVERAITEVSNNRNYFSAEILSYLVRMLEQKHTRTKTDELTNRELEVLMCICRGMSNQEIADKLYISKRTVDKHRENILQKTQSKNTAEMVVYAIKNRFFDI
ncbi:MAG: response regulator transcription factor [Tenuifilaceae bacterium]|jgi:DNA-binding NarL/FixJ family response regulator|nr:response regulator transcription factor [Tenuifilaceae bacterium]